MKKKETQRHKGQLGISSLPYHRVPLSPQSATIHRKAQPPESEEVQLAVSLQHMDYALQLLARSASLILALINSVTTHDVVTTLLFLGLATGTFSVRDALDMFSRYVLLPRVRQDDPENRNCRCS